jgi:hypothetical protein
VRWFSFLAILSCFSSTLTADELDFIRHSYPGSHVAEVAVADFNNDGILDLITVDGDASEVLISLGKGDGRFHPSQSSPANFGNDFLLTVVVEDLDGDNLLDVIWGAAGHVRVSYNAGDGVLSEPVSPFGTSIQGMSILCEDFNSDGMVDVSIAEMGTTRIFLNNGDRTFTLSQFMILDCGMVADQRAADLNRDGQLDLVGASDGLYVLSMGATEGVFQSPVYGDTGFGFVVALWLYDIDHDGLLDLVCGNYDVQVFRGLGGGEFETEPLFELENLYVNGMNIADFDNDGLIDLSTNSYYTGGDNNGFNILRGLGGGEFAEPINFPAPKAWSHTVADLNQDGRMDIITADRNSGSGVSVFLNHTGTLPADVNLDGQLNLLDRAAFIDRIASGTYQVEADLNRDGVVGLTDVCPFVEALVNGY